MKRKLLAALLLMLLALLCAAQADIPTPLDEDGKPVWLQGMRPWQGGLIGYSSVQDALYVYDTQDGFVCYPIRLLSQAPEKELRRLYDDLGALGLSNEYSEDDLFDLLCDGESLMAISSSGALYDVALEADHAAFSFHSFLDVLPTQPMKGFFHLPSTAMDAGKVYVLSNVNDPRGNNLFSSLYAFDRQTWAREIIPLDIPSSCYPMAIHPFGPEAMLIETTSRADTSSTPLFVRSMADGVITPLAAAQGLSSLPANTTILGCDAERDVILLRAQDFIYSLSAHHGLLPIGRVNEIITEGVIHPDGRAILCGTTLHEVDWQKAFVMQSLNILTDGISVPDNAYDNAIPDIELRITETFGKADQQSAAEQFANNMTTQSDRWDLYLLPITQAASIVNKGYCVPVTGEAAEAFCQRLHPFVARQVCNDAGELAMVPIDLYRRSTLAYDAEAAALLGITEEDLPRTYAELFDFIRHWDADWGDEALTHDISLFEVTVGRAIGMLRERMFHDALALSRTNAPALRAHMQELSELFDSTLPLGKEVSDVVTPYFSIPQYDYVDSHDAPETPQAPSFLFTLKISALPSSRIEHSGFHYLMNAQPIDLALAEDLKPMAIYSGYALVVNPYSQKQETIQRYLDYVMTQLSGDNQADLLRDAAEVESLYMLSYRQRMETISSVENKMDTYDIDTRETKLAYLETLYTLAASVEPFLYDVNQAQLDEYHRSVDATEAVWLDMTEAAEPCQSLWEQFLRSSASGQQLLQRMLDVSQMMDWE